jgi:hypothetical protein
MEVSGQLHAPAALLGGGGGCSRLLSYRRLGGPQSRYGRYGEYKNLLPLLSIVQPVD